MIKIISLSILLMIFYKTPLFSQGEVRNKGKNITLVVTGSGKSSKEALSDALRNAVEQAYGAFLVSKSTISRDSLLEDEIISISNGNIKQYQKISETELPNGSFSTTVKADVSLEKLNSFLQNKGYVVEFKGELFANNIMLQEINEANEVLVLSKNIEVLNELIPQVYDYKIKCGKPWMNQENNKWEIPVNVSALANKNCVNLMEKLSSILGSLSLNSSELKLYKSLNKRVYTVSGNYILRNPKSLCLLTKFGNDLLFRISAFIVSNSKNNKYGNLVDNGIYDKGIFSLQLGYKGASHTYFPVYCGGDSWGIDLINVKEGKELVKFLFSDELSVDDIYKIKEYTVEPIKGMLEFIDQK